MDLSVETLCNLLGRSRLVPAEEVRSLRQRYLAELKGANPDPEAFAQWLVAKEYLTGYQAALLLRGHADRFFLNQYKLLDQIGKGRMAGVYKAVHQLGQVVAIKVLPPSKAKDPESFGRFQREARLAARLKHPHVVRTFQLGQAEGLHYLVMEYLEGETLEEVLQRRGKLPMGEAARLIHQALMGLQHIHEQGLVHRDLKPGNLMVVPARAPGAPITPSRSRVKILDIGLGRALFDEGAPAGGGAADLTTSGTLLGTPDYMAPEQARNAHLADIRADVYSLGCVLYHLLAGRVPFPEPNLVRKMMQHATEAPPPLKTFNSEVPDGLQQIMDWMLAKDPSQRYPTPERAAQALQVFLAVEGGREVGKEAEPGMDSYIQWLETTSGGEPKDPAPAPTARTAAPAGPKSSIRSPGKAAAVPTARPPTKTGPGTTPVGRPVAKSTPKAIASAPPNVPGGLDPTVDLDVELVNVPSPPPPRAPRKKLTNLERRDFILLGIGAGVGALALLLLEGFIMLMGRLLRPKARVEETPAPEGETGGEPPSGG